MLHQVLTKIYLFCLKLLSIGVTIIAIYYVITNCNYISKTTLEVVQCGSIFTNFLNIDKLFLKEFFAYIDQYFG